MATTVIILSIAVFLAMIINLAAKPKFAGTILSICLIGSSIGGAIIYGLLFSSMGMSLFPAVARTILTVCRMYAGVHEYAAVSSSAILASPLVNGLFWVLHLMAFYATASAAISTIGAAALKRLRYWLQRYGSSVIIYGINDDTVKFGQSLMVSGINRLIYVGSKPDTACENAINASGCIVNSSLSALNPDLKFLKSIGSDKGAPELTLYALEDEDGKNILYAKKLLKAMEDANVDTKNCHLILRASDDSVECGLQQTESTYGYSDVKIFTDVSLTGRMLMKHMPPCEKVDFTPDGKATSDFDAVIVGFGKTGRSILRYLVRNAQFEGSTFHAAVFSPTANKENGHFISSYPELMSNYDISFFNSDAKSVELFSYLHDHSETLKYIVICTGNDKRDNEIRTDICSYLKLINCSPAICKCSTKTISWSVTPESSISYSTVYSADAIGSKSLDRNAMLLNFSYINDPSSTPEKEWIKCDYFSRESSRAAVDFLDAYLKITGKSEKNVAYEGWGELSPELLENLGKTEHLRWCAFHYSMGFSSMSDETVSKRGEQILNDIRTVGSSILRISKDLSKRQHACLRSWDDLDKISDLEQSYTGKKVDYKDMDIRNVLLLPSILRENQER